MNELVQ